MSCRHDGPRPDRLSSCLLVLLLAGCATQWTPRTERPDIALQWPYPPHPAKLTYVEALTGFSSNSGAAAALGSILLGREGADRGAFLLPVAVATGHDGRMAVADLGRQCVHLYVPSKQHYVQLCGSPQEPIRSPVGVAFAENLDLYVSDSTGRIFVFGADGAPLRVLASAGGEKLLRPTGIAYDARRDLLFVADTLAHRVHALRPSGDLAFSFGERGEETGRFNFPTHVFYSAAGELYVTDAMNFRIAIFDEDGRALGSFGHHGDGSGDLALPKGVAVDRDGVVYVVDGMFDHVQLFDRKGMFLLTLGKRGTDFGEWWLPGGAFIGEDDRLYVCDTYNHRVQVFRITDRYGDGAPQAPRGRDESLGGRGNE